MFEFLISVLSTTFIFIYWDGINTTTLKVFLKFLSNYLNKYFPKIESDILYLICKTPSIFCVA